MGVSVPGRRDALRPVGKSKRSVDVAFRFVGEPVRAGTTAAPALVPLVSLALLAPHTSSAGTGAFTSAGPWAIAAVRWHLRSGSAPVPMLACPAVRARQQRTNSFAWVRRNTLRRYEVRQYP